MSPQTPKDQAPQDKNLSLRPSTTAGAARSPEFSNVQGHADSVPGEKSTEFANVRGHSDTVPGGSGGSGGAGQQTYTVQAGDTLSHIAQRHYGKASRWHAIFDANRDQLDNPDLIQPGQVLTLPAIDH
jgi:nucleoid-associated protein YgaU